MGYKSVNFKTAEGDETIASFARTHISIKLATHFRDYITSQRAIPFIDKHTPASSKQTLYFQNYTILQIWKAMSVK